MATLSLRASPETVRIGVFDAIFPPIMTIASGDTVEVQCVSGRDSVMPPAGSPLGWVLSEVWDRWRERACWASQRAIRHVRSRPARRPGHSPRTQSR